MNTNMIGGVPLGRARLRLLRRLLRREVEFLRGRSEQTADFYELVVSELEAQGDHPGSTLDGAPSALAEEELIADVPKRAVVLRDPWEAENEAARQSTEKDTNQ